MKIRVLAFGGTKLRGRAVPQKAQNRISNVMTLRGGDRYDNNAETSSGICRAARLFAVYLAMKVSRQEAGTRKCGKFPKPLRKELELS